MSLAAVIPEWTRIRDRYVWMTALIIARNAIMREYQNSFLGVVWTVVLPLIQVIIFAIIMPLIMARPVENYAFFLVASFPLWAFVSGSLVQSCNSIIAHAETIKRCMVSSVIFPIADIMKQFYTYIVSFLTMYFFCVLFYVPLDPLVLAVYPLLILPIFVAVLAASIAISYLAPYVRDVGYLMHMLVNIMFWFTPIVYPITAVPEEYRWLFLFNPFYNLIHPVQQLIFWHMLPSLPDVLRMLAVMVASVVIGYFIYRACRRNYVYYL